MDLKPLTLQERFDLYLEGINIKPSRLSVNQYRELKRAFAGGLSQAVVLLFTVDEIDNIDIEIFKLAKELKHFWKYQRINNQIKF